jgi:hypothetical protein
VSLQLHFFLLAHLQHTFCVVKLHI